MTFANSGRARGMTAPTEYAFAITPNDGVDLHPETRAIYVGGRGDVTVRLAGGEQVQFARMPAGTVLPVRVTRVLVATTATHLVGLY